MPKVIFIDPAGVTREVHVEVGQSVMQAATSNLVPGIIGDCGGFLNCATCHGYVDEVWQQKLPPPSEDEIGMISCAIDPTPQSRLTCQIKMTPELDGLVIRLPHAQS